MPEDNSTHLISELDELVSELIFMRKKLGSKSFTNHLEIYNRFFAAEKRIKEIKHLLMLRGHIP